MPLVVQRAGLIKDTSQVLSAESRKSQASRRNVQRDPSWPRQLNQLGDLVDFRVNLLMANRLVNGN